MIIIIHTYAQGLTFQRFKIGLKRTEPAIVLGYQSGLYCFSLP